MFVVCLSYENGGEIVYLIEKYFFCLSVVVLIVLLFLWEFGIYLIFKSVVVLWFDFIMYL